MARGRRHSLWLSKDDITARRVSSQLQQQRNKDDATACRVSSQLHLQRNAAARRVSSADDDVCSPSSALLRARDHCAPMRPRSAFPRRCRGPARHQHQHPHQDEYHYHYQQPQQLQGNAAARRVSKWIRILLSKNDVSSSRSVLFFRIIIVVCLCLVGILTRVTTTCAAAEMCVVKVPGGVVLLPPADGADVRRREDLDPDPKDLPRRQRSRSSDDHPNLPRQDRDMDRDIDKHKEMPIDNVEKRITIMPVIIMENQEKNVPILEKNIPILENNIIVVVMDNNNNNKIVHNNVIHNHQVFGGKSDQANLFEKLTSGSRSSQTKLVFEKLTSGSHSSHKKLVFEKLTSGSRSSQKKSVFSDNTDEDVEDSGAHEETEKPGME
ncbi:hypothetical protein CBR_g22998 [Chara braunii]|uniref:Uncharacterized protein n=1 Tax=Chara braunii TaxID=69332 RepID=A0A388L3F4_CHABU|nr:hypothetical protein CBR_g22998 [Chara braunii]|eukprot:GBG76782.1 hypothetical protein CBR_g22998 [Chara braunii]